MATPTSRKGKNYKNHNSHTYANYKIKQDTSQTYNLVLIFGIVANSCLIDPEKPRRITFESYPTISSILQLNKKQKKTTRRFGFLAWLRRDYSPNLAPMHHLVPIICFPIILTPLTLEVSVSVMGPRRRIIICSVLVSAPWVHWHTSSHVVSTAWWAIILRITGLFITTKSRRGYLLPWPLLPPLGIKLNKFFPLFCMDPPL